MASAPIDESVMIIQKYDISGIYARELNRLKGFKLILILDDSTSMRETLENNLTKWDELRRSCEIVLDIANAFKIECDVMFLNRPGMRNVQHITQLQEQFATLPSGLTPLTASFNIAIENNRAEFTERKLLIIIFTDGAPTSQNQGNPIEEFRKALKDRDPIDRIFVTIAACTDDKNALKYLNDWDRTIPNLDVIDDYKSEKDEIYKSGRSKQAFTFGDYIAKILLGSHVPELDKADERRRTARCTLV